MELSDFQRGAVYSIITKEYSPDGESVIPGKTMVRRILEPATRENSRMRAEGNIEMPTDYEVAGWQAFLRVQNVDSGRVHLLHPETIESATMVQEQ
ncbi:MAG: hypothetical protein CVV05_01550 [Gammaproteobacteria bacterium HGW-Gammaproteobacteria-1]|jgi:hypothetical protein|nr:MAG: hypothetical protein CVV05_01550 [Gammaproteobacteria bacterium HGW-Gammaproteobacteria-1]